VTSGGPFPPRIFNTSDYLNSSPTLGSQGEIHVLGSQGWGSEGYLYSILPNGTLNWKAHIFDDIEVFSIAPAVGDGGDIFVNLPRDVFVCMDPNGSEKWRFEDHSSSSNSPTIGHNGTIYMASGRGDLYAFDPNGDLLWECRYSLDSQSTPAIAEDGSIYFGDLDGTFHCLQANGSVRWTLEVSLNHPLDLVPHYRWAGERILDHS
jgi:outer membrane protein assembly factor BamB